MTNYQPSLLAFRPGIQRDGTRLSTPGNWIDGQWTRFHNGRPKKMGGYRQVLENVSGIVREFELYQNDATTFVACGSGSGISQFQLLHSTGEATSPLIRTLTSFTFDGTEMPQMQTAFDPIIGNAATLIVHPGRNLNDISSAAETGVYIGPSATSANLTLLSNVPAISGGICFVYPYLTFFGSDGYMGWTGPNKLNEVSVSEGGGGGYITSQKIVAGRPVSGGTGPSALYWSLDSLIRSTFIGGTATWGFDHVSKEISIISSRSIATLNGGVFYWMGLNRFFVFNGQSVEELPNPRNADWVFDNINMDYHSKCFAYADTRFGEIWFCYPRGSATECSHAVIYNARLNEWYDTILPNGGRSAAESAKIWEYPLMGGVEEVTAGKYRVWEHENGTNEVRNASVGAVRAFIESSDVSFVTGEKPTDVTVSCQGVEADIKQAGEMTLTLTGNANARSAARSSEAITFQPGPVDEGDQILRPKAEYRQMRFKWESNVVDGNFEIGNCIAHIGPGTGRATG